VRPPTYNTAQWRQLGISHPDSYRDFARGQVGLPFDKLRDQPVVSSGKKDYI